ncbi:MAG: DNA ligase (NAD(+)) LigA [Bacteroidetes bacterium]|nr:DNA ligase (NAD(+)) LigA [Bacteroidota bacterium]
MADFKSFPDWELVTEAFLKGTRPLEESDNYEQLIELITFHERCYYVQNEALISDESFDKLFQILKNFEQSFPERLLSNSPTQRVGSDLTEDGDSVEHLSPMLSLENSYNADDLIEWDQQIKRLLQLPVNMDIAYAIEPKFDGGSIALVYENDSLVRAATRGNGILGEEITGNAKAIRSIPIKAKFSNLGIYKAELRGEVLIRKDVFASLNEQRKEENLSLFANARNTATGGLRMKDPKEVAKRGMEAFIYTFGYAVDSNNENVLSKFTSHHESMDILADLGFKVPEKEREVCANIEEVIRKCENWQIERNAYPYEIDGIVVKVDARELQERAGFTAHHPRWAIAFKFKAQQAQSTLLEVEYQVGKIGSITPVAKIKPTELAGVTIKSISLHNEDFITSKDLRIGDSILVERAGDVIPYISKCFPELRNGSEKIIQFPSFCPVNNTDQPVKLVREAGESAWRCLHCVCGAQNLQKLIFHVSKEAMDIDGLGSSIVERFYDLGFIKSLPDIYRLPYDKIIHLEKFKAQSVKNLKNSIDKAKNNPIHRLLHSLGIHHLGKKASKLLAFEINHVLELASWNKERFLQIKDIGPVVADNVIAYFNESSNLNMIKIMEELGVNMIPTVEDRPKEVSSNSPFYGKTILFTGTLTLMGRKEAQEKAEHAGAKNISAVSNNLDFLVVGEKAGSKRKKAEEIPTITILTEKEFIDLLNKE